MVKVLAILTVGFRTYRIKPSSWSRVISGPLAAEARADDLDRSHRPIIRGRFAMVLLSSGSKTKFRHERIDARVEAQEAGRHRWV